MPKPRWSKSERKALIELARLQGMSDEEILRKIIVGVRGAEKRKDLIIQWGDLMGLDASAALQKARRAGLILTTRLPMSPRDKSQPPE